MANKLLSKICKTSIAMLTALTFTMTPYIIANEIKTPKKEWKISAYLDGDSNIDLAVYTSFNQLEKVGSNETMDIYAQLDRWEPEEEPFVIKTLKIDGFFKTKRFHVQKDEDMDVIGSKEEPGFDKELNMGSYKVFEDFIDWVEKSESNKHMLIIKGHGYGIMVPLDQVLSNYFETTNKEDSALPTYTIDKVFNSKLKQKLELIIFDSCEKATIEVAYQLKEHAKVLVASEDLSKYSTLPVGDSVICILSGPDYEKILNKINNNPNIDVKELGKFIVKSYFEQLSNPAIPDKSVTLSAINLEGIETFTQKFSAFSNILIKNMADEKTRKETITTLQKSLEKTQSYMAPDSTSLYTHVDLFDFLKNVCKITKNKELISAIKNLKQSDIIIKSKYKGKDLEKSNGISIMFMTNYESIKPYNYKTNGKTTIEHVKDYYSKSEFAQKTGWDKVQEMYIEYSQSE